MDKIDSAADLKKDFPHPPIVSCERIPVFVDISPQITPSAVVHNEEHLFAAREEEVFVEGDDVWVGGDELVVTYFARGMEKSVIDVVRGWDTRSIWVGDVDDFHSPMNTSVNQIRQLEVDDLVHSAETPRADATLDKVPAGNHPSDEGRFEIVDVRWARESSDGHNAAGWSVPGAPCGGPRIYTVDSSLRRNGYLG